MKTKARILQAQRSDREEIYALYKMQLGRDYCAWNEHYPEYDTIDFDLERDALFVMKEEAPTRKAAEREEKLTTRAAEQKDEELTTKAAEQKEEELTTKAAEQEEELTTKAAEREEEELTTKATEQEEELTTRAAEREDEKLKTKPLGQGLSLPAGKIIAAISLDADEEVEALKLWSKELAPGGEIARVAVHPDYQNQGLARIMMTYAMETWRRRGKKSAHFLVNKSNIKAMRSYEKLAFKCLGECELYEQEFWCFEKEL